MFGICIGEDAVLKVLLRAKDNKESWERLGRTLFWSMPLMKILLGEKGEC